MNVFLDESRVRQQLLPFTNTRHTADIQTGILTIREKWKLLLSDTDIIITNLPSADYLSVPANVIPTIDNYQQILSFAKEGKELPESDIVKYIEYPWNIFQLNDWSLRKDFDLITHNRTSMPIPDAVKAVNPKDIFIEEGAKIHHCSLNAEAGPIYIGKNSIIMEGALIRGPFALGESGVVKMGAKIYGATSTGVSCVLGGEIKNAVFFDYSNKAHDGYLGDSVIGSWCNLGAGTTNSNVKNNGTEIFFKTSNNESSVSAGTKAGLLMGDYSKSAINTSFNTGTMVGVCCNIFGNTYPEKYVPDFSWGNERYQLEKALRDIDNWKKMKNKSISEEEINTIHKLYNQI